MTLRVEYTDKDQMWDALTGAPSNPEELFTLIETECRADGRLVQRGGRVLVVHLLQCAATNRSANLYFSFSTGSKWFVSYYDSNKRGPARVRYETDYRRFYGRQHLHAIIDAVIKHAPTVYAE